MRKRTGIMIESGQEGGTGDLQLRKRTRPAANKDMSGSLARRGIRLQQQHSGRLGGSVG